MLNKAKDFLRRRVRAVQRAGQYPVLLPHHAVNDAGIASVNGESRALPSTMRKALSLCDGGRSLAEVARQAGVAKADLIRAQDEGLLIVWRSPVPADVPQSQHPPHSIIVSPHLDDAALCCGGRMLGDEAVRVVNVFSRGAWWRFAFTPEDAECVEACRRAEEALVSRLSGATTTDLRLPEALLRGHAMADVFTATPGTRDDEVSAAISRAIATMAREHRLTHWYVPLGVGDHIDHRIVRDAAAAALRTANVPPTHLHYYEDLPYAAKLGPEADFAKRLPGQTLRAELLEIDDLIDWKLELLRAYWSQFRWSELEELRRYAKGVGGGEASEVAWTPAA